MQSSQRDRQTPKILCQPPVYISSGTGQYKVPFPTPMLIFISFKRRIFNIPSAAMQGLPTRFDFHQTQCEPRLTLPAQPPPPSPPSIAIARTITLRAPRRCRTRDHHSAVCVTADATFANAAPGVQRARSAVPNGVRWSQPFIGDTHRTSGTTRNGMT